jgi:hypothetical protein
MSTKFQDPIINKLGSILSEDINIEMFKHGVVGVKTFKNYAQVNEDISMDEFPVLKIYRISDDIQNNTYSKTVIGIEYAIINPELSQVAPILFIVGSLISNLMISDVKLQQFYMGRDIQSPVQINYKTEQNEDKSTVFNTLMCTSTIYTSMYEPCL